jgi:hypothetical protein
MNVQWPNRMLIHRPDTQSLRTTIQVEGRCCGVNRRPGDGFQRLELLRGVRLTYCFDAELSFGLQDRFSKTPLNCDAWKPIICISVPVTTVNQLTIG